MRRSEAPYGKQDRKYTHNVTMRQGIRFFAWYFSYCNAIHSTLLTLPALCNNPAAFGNDVTIATKLNSVALVRMRTIPTERPPPVGEVSANFCG